MFSAHLLSVSCSDAPAPRRSRRGRRARQPSFSTASASCGLCRAAWPWVEVVVGGVEFEAARPPRKFYKCSRDRSADARRCGAARHRLRFGGVAEPRRLHPKLTKRTAERGWRPRCARVQRVRRALSAPTQRMVMAENPSLNQSAPTAFPRHWWFEVTSEDFSVDSHSLAA